MELKLDPEERTARHLKAIRHMLQWILVVLVLQAASAVFLAWKFNDAVG